MRTLLQSVLICLLASAGVALAQDKTPAPVPAAAQDKTAAAAVAPPENPLSEHSRFVYRVVTKMLLRSAELMPEENYGFKPTEAVRSFGQIVGHIADSQYAFCSVVLGEKNPLPGVEKTKSSKGDLIAALNDAVAYCARSYAGFTDASATAMVKLHGRDMPKLGVLNINQNHTMEHYGNLVTYLRMKNIVPPTSDPEFMKQVAK